MKIIEWNLKLDETELFDSENSYSGILVKLSNDQIFRIEETDGELQIVCTTGKIGQTGRLNITLESANSAHIKMRYFND